MFNENLPDSTAKWMSMFSSKKIKLKIIFTLEANKMYKRTMCAYTMVQLKDLIFFKIPSNVSIHE